MHFSSTLKIKCPPLLSEKFLTSTNFIIQAGLVSMTFASIRSTTTVLVSTDSVGVFGWKTLRATVFGDEKVSPKHWRHHQQPSFSLYEMLFFLNNGLLPFGDHYLQCCQLFRKFIAPLRSLFQKLNF